jgi:hypothetical protein
VKEEKKFQTLTQSTVQPRVDILRGIPPDDILQKDIPPTLKSFSPGHSDVTGAIRIGQTSTFAKRAKIVTSCLHFLTYFCFFTTEFWSKIYPCLNRGTFNFGGGGLELSEFAFFRWQSVSVFTKLMPSTALINTEVIFRLLPFVPWISKRKWLSCAVNCVERPQLILANQCGSSLFCAEAK